MLAIPMTGKLCRVLLRSHVVPKEIKPLPHASSSWTNEREADKHSPTLNLAPYHALYYGEKWHMTGLVSHVLAIGGFSRKNCWPHYHSKKEYH